MADELNNLTGAEYQIIGKAMAERMAGYEGLPAGTKIDYQAINGPGHIGFLNMPGGKYLHRDVYGGFDAQLPFQIGYMISGTGNSDMLSAETIIDGMAEYLSAKPYPVLTGGRIINLIDFDSTTYRSQAGNDGSIILVRSGSVRYECY